MMVFSSDALNTAAAVALQGREQRRSARRSNAARLRQGFALLSGDTARAAELRAEKLLAAAETNDELLATASRILLLTARANRELEQWLQRMYDLNLVTPAAILLARQLGKQLDRACASAIDQLGRLCTPLDPIGVRPGGSSSTPAADWGEAEWDRTTRGDGRVETQSFGDSSPAPEALVLHPANTFGDTNAPEHIITVVPGVGSSTPDGEHTALTRAATLHRETGATVVAWQGYTAPANIAAALATEPARVGAKALVEYQSQLRRTYPDARLTVVGYSYGSVVAGHAAASALEADTIVFAGSPGVPRQGLEHNNVVSVLGGRDPIGLTGTAFGALHGADPHALNSGARTHWLGGDHGDYFTDPAFHQLLQDAGRRDP